jgi:hypothetical protein
MNRFGWPLKPLPSGTAVICWRMVQPVVGIAVTCAVFASCWLAPARARQLSALCETGVPIADAAEYQPGSAVHHVAIVEYVPGMSGNPVVLYEESDQLGPYTEYPPGWRAELSETELVACQDSGSPTPVRLLAAKSAELVAEATLRDWSDTLSWPRYGHPRYGRA